MDGRKTVVFADDDPHVSAIACRILRKSYNIVGAAVDGEEALRYVRALRPDFVVLDIAMPKMNGLTVATRLRQIGCTAKIVFLTCMEDEDYISAARMLGNGYVLKRRIGIDLVAAMKAAENTTFFVSG